MDAWTFANVVVPAVAVPPPSAPLRLRQASPALPAKDHADRFKQFHEDNPQVYEELVRLARHALAQRARRGVTSRHLGIRMLWEVTRWNLTIETDDANSDLKLNDHYHSRYARLIMEEESDLGGIFELRELRTPEVP